MTEIKIGRDESTGKLRLTVGGKTQAFGEAGSVPKDVSREHVAFGIDDEGRMLIRNLNVENDTYVNGFGVELKRIRENDRIELGRTRYQLLWDMLRPFVPKVADIRPLRAVWEDYQNKKMKLQIRERQFGVLRSATGLITMAAMVMGMVSGRDNSLYLSLYIAAGVISAVLFAVAFVTASKFPKQQRQLDENVKQRYRCPVCNSLFSLQSYDMLSQQKKCLHCGAVLKKS